jgi:hypothetical protein
MTCAAAAVGGEVNSSAEFLERRYRFLDADIKLRPSCGYFPCNVIIPADVLRAAIGLWAPRPDPVSGQQHLVVYTDHETSARNWCGKVLGSEWIDAANGLPPAVGGPVQFDRVAEPKVARGVETGVLRAVSTAWTMTWRKSHPELDDYEFREAMWLDLEKDGRPVCQIAEKIEEVYELSVVWAGASPYARQIESLDRWITTGSLIREAAPEGSVWDVLFIEQGLSLNGRRYGESFLRKAAPQFERASVYAYDLGDRRDHLDLATKDELGAGAGLLRNRVGQLTGVSYGEVNGRKGLLARLEVAAEWARSVLRDLWSAGQQAAAGFSIDAMCSSLRLADGTEEVIDIAAHPTVDLVSHPAAGGRLVRLVASVTGGQNMEPNTGAQTPAPALTEAQVQNMIASQLLAVQCGAAVSSRVQGSGLPVAAQTRLTESLAAQTASAKSVQDAVAAADRAIEAEREYIRTIGGAPAVTGCGATRESSSQVGADRLDKLQVAMDGFFAGKDLEYKGARVPRFITIREAIRETSGHYLGDDISAIEILGQMRGYRGHYSGTRKWDRRTEGVLQPGSGFRRVVEAIDSSTFAQILGDSVSRKMVKDFATSPLNNWRSIVSDVVPLADYRTQRRTIFGWYGELATVAENHNYPDLTTPGDTEETYAPAKRGGIETITEEMLRNDDVGLFRRIPGRMAYAAILTLHRSVFGIFTANAVMADGVALFHAASHGNLGSSAFSGRAMRDVRLAMMDQIPYGGSAEHTLGAVNTPKYILHPNELCDQVEALTKSPVAIAEPSDTGAMPSDANATIPNPAWYRGMLGIQVPYWTNASQYVAVADPALIPTIEVGFIDGMEEPELMVADDPTSGGSRFTADKIQLRVKLAWGAKALDHRSMYRMTP